MSRKYLFVCFANLNRSPFAAKWFAEYCRERQIDVESESAGIYAWQEHDNEGRKTIQLTKEMVDWADVICVMREHIAKDITKKYPQARDKRIVNLDIPDVFNPKETDSYASNFSVNDALVYLERNRYNPELVIGRELFSRILEGKLEKILG